MHKITKRQQGNLSKAADLIEANPEHFDMEVWVCETSACIYGYAAMVDQDKSIKQMDKWFNNNLRSYERDNALHTACGFWDVRLFTGLDWFDCEAKLRYFNAVTLEAKAKAAADYVRWFVENHTEVSK
jgi:hypothetical protein